MHNNDQTYILFLQDKCHKTNMNRRGGISEEHLALIYIFCILKGWLVGWLVLDLTAFETVFQSIAGRLPKRGRKRKERIDESKNVQTTPTRT